MAYTLRSLALLIALGAMAFCMSTNVRSAVAQGMADEDSTVIVATDATGEKAQQQDNEDQVEETGTKDEVAELRDMVAAKIQKSWDPTIDEMPSLFFTFWQHQSIIDAKNARGVRRPPTEAELRALEEDSDIKPDPEKRYVSLGGIVYKAENDWTIWLNGQRVTPDAVPKEVLDLKVFKDYIEVKWLDEFTNSVFPLRLRAHQRFNMDMRIFLPG